MPIRYSISILTYTELDRVRRCIASVMANSPEGEYELILTANGPIAAEYFRSLAARPNVIVIENAENEGFIKPSIRALERATGEFYVALNDDATVPPGWLEKLRIPFDGNPMMGLTGPEGGCCAFDARIQGVPSRTPEYIEFACAMGRVSVLRKMGLFADALTFAYFEDSELGLRLREAGYALRLVPFRIVHARGATSKMMPEIRKFQAMNGAYFRRRHAGYLRARRFDYVTVIRRAGAIGDVLLTTPIIRALKERNPRSPIWVETECPDVFDGNPHVARAGRSLALPPDAWVINLNMAYENAPQTHIVSAYAQAAGVEDYSCRTELYTSQEDRRFAIEKLGQEYGGDGWIAVHVGPTTWSGKNWPMERWAEVIALIEAKNIGRVVLVGSQSVPQLPIATLDLRGKTTRGQLAAVLARCRLLVTLDSFPLHAAQAVGCPVVGLFGVTSAEFIVTEGSHATAVNADRANPSTGIRHRTRNATFVEDPHACMETITVDAVMEAIESATCHPTSSAV